MVVVRRWEGGGGVREARGAIESRGAAAMHARGRQRGGAARLSHLHRLLYALEEGGEGGEAKVGLGDVGLEGGEVRAVGVVAHVLQPCDRGGERAAAAARTREGV